MEGTGVWHRIGKELGFTTLLSSPKDVFLIFLTRFLRMLAYGSSTLILALMFAELGHSDTKIGLFMTLTLVGDVLISLALTFVADTLGRRNTLILGSLLMVLSGAVFATVSNYWILLLAAIFGVISPSGNEIGPFRAVEEATLAQLSELETRSDIFAWYVVIGTLGTAGGSLGCGWLIQYLTESQDWTAISAYRLIFFVYAGIGLLKAGVGALMSTRCEVKSEAASQPSPPPPARQPPRDETVNDAEADEGEEQPLLSEQRSLAQTQPSQPQAKAKKASKLATISEKSRKTLVKLCGLFFFDSLASGMVPNSLIAFFMKRKFGMPEGQLGTIMSIAQFMSSIGNIFAASVARRIGLVRAMVFTHLPSAILLGLIPAPPLLLPTVIVLVARSSLASMDQAPRSAFLTAVVLPEERTATMGIVNTVKTMSQSSGPLITGILAGGGRFWIAFVVAGSLKASYDIGMLSMFVNLKLEGDKGSKQAKAQRGEASQDESRPNGLEEPDQPSNERSAGTNLRGARS